ARCASPESIAVLEKWIPGSREEARPGMTETTAVSLCLIVSLHCHGVRWLWVPLSHHPGIHGHDTEFRNHGLQACTRRLTLE
ncbi:MAG: hypothetical protein ACOY91_09430, partial [Pseudomonadota bacterium]